MEQGILHYLKDDSIVCDYQLVYETDNCLLLDFYAYSVAMEGKILGLDFEAKIPNYGMIKIPYKQYIELQAEIEKVTSDINTLSTIFPCVSKKVEKLIYENNKIEKEIRENKYCVKNLLELLDSVIEMMAYRRLMDNIAETYVQRVSIERMEQINIPSYVQLFRKNMKYMCSKENIDKFIWEYGYLGSFNIAKCEYEEESFLMQNVGKKGQVKELKMDYDPEKCISLEEQIVYYASWYAELRHVYQLRTLRNCRIFLEYLKRDIFTTSIRELRENV